LLQGSVLDEGASGDTDMKVIVEIWTVAEDDPHVVDAEIEEAIDLLLETEDSSDVVVDVGDEDEPEAMDAVVDDETPVPAAPVLEAEANLGELRRHSKKAGNLPSDATCLLDHFGGWRRVQQQASRHESSPTLHHFFKADKKQIDEWNQHLTIMDAPCWPESSQSGQLDQLLSLWLEPLAKEQNVGTHKIELELSHRCVCTLVAQGGLEPDHPNDIGKALTTCDPSNVKHQTCAFGVSTSCVFGSVWKRQI
jgi:hypothetical protein